MKNILLILSSLTLLSSGVSFASQSFSVHGHSGLPASEWRSLNKNDIRSVKNLTPKVPYVLTISVGATNSQDNPQTQTVGIVLEGCDGGTHAAPGQTISCTLKDVVKWSSESDALSYGTAKTTIRS